MISHLWGFQENCSSLQDKFIEISACPPLFRDFDTNGLFADFNLTRERHKIIFLLDTDQRGTDLFLETAQVLHYNPQLKFVLPDSAENKASALEISGEVPENVYYFKNKADNFLNYLKDASIGLLLSQETDPYFQGKGFYQLLMASVPVIVPAGGFTEKRTMELGVGSVLLRNDPIELAKVILSMLYDHQQYPLLKKNCCKASEKYCWENEKAKLTELYRTLLQ
ncbi:MAG: hypothetical protein PHW04_17850 [Candidatus Wallbacteria bacterium]|nr:hypothetical protein [Candidatus Wallbacteria bacterium]